MTNPGRPGLQDRQQGQGDHPEAETGEKDPSDHRTGYGLRFENS